MDFYKIKERSGKNGVIEIYPDFKVGRSHDLLVRGKSFYAIWDAEAGLWSTDEYDVQRLVDAELMAYRDQAVTRIGDRCKVMLMGEFSSNVWLQFRNYINHVSDNAHQLDENLVFSNTEVKKKDYASRRLPYPLEEGPVEAWDTLISTLYAPEERAKLEWAIGAIVSGDAKDIQKFIVLYGEAGTGKSTVLNIVQKLFQGYYTTFEAKALTSSNNAFSTEMFKSNPLVAIQHDGDLSKIEDNTKLNSIISHEEMTMNEKYKPSYMSRVNCFLFMGTNKPVRITDAKSGIIRRLIDVKPTGEKLPARKYQTLMSQIDFELGAIAYHCLQTYLSMGKDYYAGYRPVEMMLQTDVFFNFIEANFGIFKEQNGVSLAQAYELYKQYCDETLVDFKLARYKFREELKNYFAKFEEVARVDGTQIRSYYSGFLTKRFTSIAKKAQEDHQYSLVMDKRISIFDELFAECPAQYATIDEVPISKWADVSSTLADIDTTKVHYVKLPSNHIVIDFDLKDGEGAKSAERNLEAASKWPATYAEWSKSGSGIHLHYNYEGNPADLSRVYEPGIEIKVFTGNASLRRRFSRGNSRPIASIASGLPLKEKPVLNFDGVKSERGLRELIARNLRKEIHPGTKPSIDFIHKILEDAYLSPDLRYDVTDLRPSILAFAVNSTNQAEYCVKRVNEMKFNSEEPSEDKASYENSPLVFFDVEVFPNLFVVSWLEDGDGKQVVHMINPSPAEIESLIRWKLVGFNNRRYDNHILYAALMGYNNAQLYDLSQRIINKSKNAMFAEAYNLSYADIYDFASEKKSLKHWQIELKIHHKELGLPWDQPVPEELWDLVAEYCGNDVVSTKATFYARYADFVARQILADLSGLTVNDSTQKHTARIIFGKDKEAQKQFVYTDLSVEFPGYLYDFGTSSYRGEVTGEGGYVYAEPGIYTEVGLLDIASMHPSTIKILNLFGKYTSKFYELLEARLAIKHKDYDTARKLLDGRLGKYLGSADDSAALAYALKIVINIVYGLTSAKFDNPFRDVRNVDNIVAKRGALFMIDLKHAVQEQGFAVAHIKTDSIKIPNATPEIIEFVMEFGRKYGYTFEHEATYDKMCLVNEAVYIAKHGDIWEPTGAQFAQPYVYKTLFSREELSFDDMCETKAVTTAIYLDMNEGLPEDQHDYHFVGRIGRFAPVKPGAGGALLMRQNADGDKYSAVTGTKGFRWLEAEMVILTHKEDDVDRRYHDGLVDDALKAISKYGDPEWFLS